MTTKTAARTNDPATATETHPSARHLAGETISIPERMIVAPSVGRFRLTCVAYEGAFVDEGQEIGVIEGPSASQSVRSPFAGRLMGVLAHPGERLRAGEPVAWLRAS
jgi:biotin carboxyl carrier protein